MTFRHIKTCKCRHKSLGGSSFRDFYCDEPTVCHSFVVIIPQWKESSTENGSSVLQVCMRCEFWLIWVGLQLILAARWLISSQISTWGVQQTQKTETETLQRGGRISLDTCTHSLTHAYTQRFVLWVDRRCVNAHVGLSYGSLYWKLSLQGNTANCWVTDKHSHGALIKTWSHLHIQSILLIRFRLWAAHLCPPSQ